MLLRMTLSLALVAPIFSSVAFAQAAKTPEQEMLDAKNGPFQKLGPWLENLYQEFQGTPNKKAFKTKNPVLRVTDGKVSVDMYATNSASLQSSLKALGAVNIKAKGPLVSVRVPVGALATLAGLPSLNFGNPVLARTQIASQGSVVSQGDAALHADDARAATGLD